MRIGRRRRADDPVEPTWASECAFVEPLLDLRHAEARDRSDLLRAELERELTRGHPLHGTALRVVAEAIPQDEVIVETADGRVALVHLTFARRPERPPWPMTTLLQSPEHLAEVLEFRY